MQENRLARVEAQLSGRQRVLAWMHRQQELGGYMQMVTRSAETHGASGATIELLDPEGDPHGSSDSGIGGVMGCSR